MGRDELVQALAEGAVAGHGRDSGLINAVDEARRRQVDGGGAALLNQRGAASGRDNAESRPAGACRRVSSGRAGVIAEVGVVLVRLRDAQRVMKIVGPDGVELPAALAGGLEDLGGVALILGDGNATAGVD